LTIALISRIVKQKGIGVLMTPCGEGQQSLIEKMLQFRGARGEKIQLVIMGLAGDPQGENVVRGLTEIAQRPEYKGQFAFLQEFNPGLAKQMGAGAVAAIMPSIDEPGGIANQELALLLDLLVVTDRGGLIDFYEQGGTPIAPVPGFEIGATAHDDWKYVAQRMRSAAEIFNRVQEIFHVYQNEPAKYEAMLKRVRQFNPDWNGGRDELYEKIYRETIANIPENGTALGFGLAELVALVEDQLTVAAEYGLFPCDGRKIQKIAIDSVYYSYFETIDQHGMGIVYLKKDAAYEAGKDRLKDAIVKKYKDGLAAIGVVPRKGNIVIKVAAGKFIPVGTEQDDLGVVTLRIEKGKAVLIIAEEFMKQLQDRAPPEIDRLLVVHELDEHAFLAANPGKNFHDFHAIKKAEHNALFDFARNSILVSLFAGRFPELADELAGRFFEN
jgi:hypothetical protein